MTQEPLKMLDRRQILAAFAASPFFAELSGRSANGATQKAPKVILIAGKPSHGPGDHEFNAGITLLGNCLTESGLVEPVIVRGGWPNDETIFDDAKAVIFFMDGGGNHPMIQSDRLVRVMKPMLDKGVGLGCLHYAVEVPNGNAAERFLEWIGGYYESGFSTNPHWVAEIKELPDHQITQGVKPFAVKDEWYFNIHFSPELKSFTPILTATPSNEARQGKTSYPPGPHPHIVAANGRPEVISWAIERPDGGRGFGFTGGHDHENWSNDNFRKLILNAILWLAKVNVPVGGVLSSPGKEDLTSGLDPKK